MANNYLKKEELNKVYKLYSSRYDDVARRQKTKGIAMYIPKLSKVEFREMYAAWGNTIDAEENKGFGSQKTKSKYIIEKLIEEERYALSDKQAKAYQKAYADKHDGAYISLTDIHRNAPKELSDMNEWLINEGVTDAAKRSALIAQAYFGSP